MSSSALRSKSMTLSSREYGPPLAFLAGILLVWQALGSLLGSDVLPTPLQTLQAIADDWQVLLQNSMQTLLETTIGLLCAIALGMGLAVALYKSRLIRRAVYPVLVISQTIPIIALAPLFIIWFGFGTFPKVLVCMVYCFFPIAIGTSHSMLGTDRDLLRLLESMNASSWKVLWLVELPASLPAFFSGLSIAATYSVVGALYGESAGAYSGLGVYMQGAFNAHGMSQLFGAVVLVCLLSYVLFLIVQFVAYVSMPWYRASSAQRVNHQ